MQAITAIDLFCGTGGLSHGLIQSGINVVLGVDNDSFCEYSYTANNAEFLLKSIIDLSSEELKKYYPNDQLKLLAGCAPCQPFSKVNTKTTDIDSRKYLMLEFARLVEELLPEYVVMENVPGVYRETIFKMFLNRLQKHGYFTTCLIVNCSDYGIPQMRKRLILVASKHPGFSFLSPERFDNKLKTVRDAIAHLPPIASGETDSSDSLHCCTLLNDLNLKRIQSSIPGSTWKEWPEELLLECRKVSHGKSFLDSHGRMSWDKPSPTITTKFNGYGNGRYGHPEQDRGISLREGALLQSFPPTYRFSKEGEKILLIKTAKLIGNAVPPRLGFIVGKSILEHASKYFEK